MPGGTGPNPSNAYGSAVSPSLAFAGIDQGIDFTGAGDVYALGNAVITRIQRSGSGWPGEGAVLNYRITSGPATGKYVYVAEDFAPRSDLRVGSTVKAGETIGRATGSGRAPGIEIGWAQASGIPAAPRPPARPAPQYTPQGADFANFVRSGNAGGQSHGIGSLIPPNPLGPGNILGFGGGPASNLVGDATSAVSGVVSVGTFLGRLTDPSYILRGLQIVAGAVLVLAGIVLLTRQVALAADLPDPVGLAAAAASKTPAVPVE